MDSDAMADDKDDWALDDDWELGDVHEGAAIL